MKILEFEQQSPEWFAFRCGRPSSSNFSKIVTTKGERSKSAKEYLYKLAGEKVTGEKEQGHTSEAMQYGIDTEDEARAVYELISGLEVLEVGTCTDDNERYCSSPDGMIGEDGLLEIKCPKPNTHVKYLLDDKLPTTYFQQVQGQLWVTGRDWCDFFSYCKGMKPFIVRVFPDKDFHEKLETELNKFCDELDEIVKQIKE
jgi:putative phage-type endonuclease